MADVEMLLIELEEQMDKAQDFLKREFAKLRTGKASPTLVEDIKVEYYGVPTRLKDMANITCPEARLIQIQPFDQSVVKAVEKAILSSNIGISPVSDGRILRLPMPELDQQRRKDLVKQAKTKTEESKVKIRNVRRDGNDKAKKAQKNGDISEDELKSFLDDIQKLTDDKIKFLDSMLSEKEKDILTI
jgi:ribosome recycling factor